MAWIATKSLMMAAFDARMIYLMKSLWKINLDKLSGYQWYLVLFLALSRAVFIRSRLVWERGRRRQFWYITCLVSEHMKRKVRLLLWLLRILSLNFDSSPPSMESCMV